MAKRLSWKERQTRSRLLSQMPKVPRAIRVVPVGHYQVVLNGDYAFVFRLVWKDAKRYRFKLAPGSPHWRQAVAMARRTTKNDGI